MSGPEPAEAADLTETRFVLPPDAKCLPVADLTVRLREKIGPVDAGQSVITRPGFRLTPRLVPGPLAALVGEFREPSLITDAVLRFSRAHDQEPDSILEQAFDALATLIEGRILVPSDSLAAGAPEPSLAAGQGFGGWEIEFLVRSLEDTEVYKARDSSGRPAALKIARDDRADIAGLLANEARILRALGGRDSPRFYGHVVEGGRSCVAMEWCDGTGISAAAQQARSARDPALLHRLAGSLFDAYARLHEAGFLHCDIHTGNVLIRDDGRVAILDFGTAAPIAEPGPFLPAGIPHFHAPEVAVAILDGRRPAPASPATEQYALCVLAYLLVTGLHPVRSSAVHEELLGQIATAPPLPFASRGVPAWPAAEAVLARGLSKRPGARFADVGRLARAWAAAAPEPARSNPAPAWVGRALDSAVQGMRDLAPSTDDPLDRAWLALRAALVLEDSELLAAAEILVGAAGPGAAAAAVAAQIGRAGSDPASEQKAITEFLAAAADLPDGLEASLALLAAAEILDGIGARQVGAEPLIAWASDRLARRVPGDSPDAVLRLHAELAIGLTGALPYPAGLARRLDALARAGGGDSWLWADAHSAFGKPRFKRLALAAPLPSGAVARGFAMLRLHRLTGELGWVEDATRALASAPRGAGRAGALLAALLAVELEAPERAVLPSFLLPRLLRG